MENKNNKGRDLTTIISAAFAAVIVITLVLYGVIAFVSFGLPALKGKPETVTVDKEKDTEAASPDADAEGGDSAEEDTEEKVSIRTTEAVPETVKRDENAEILALAREDVDLIGAEHDGTVNMFTTGGDRDADNRPVAVNDFLDRMRAAGVYATCYASDTNTKKVAFTFRAGNEAGCTEEVLNILDNYSIKSTFYISHYYAANSADMVRRMISDGHELGNHSYTCPAEGIANHALDDQMADAANMQNYIQQAYNYKMTKYNYNTDHWSEASAVMLSKMGYEICFHSAGCADEDPNGEYDAETTLAALKEQLHPGAVYSFHLTNSVTAQVLPALVEYCKSEGYQITQLD